MEGKRIQMPDVYRIAYGLGRRGGVKPLKQTLVTPLVLADWSEKP